MIWFHNALTTIVNGVPTTIAAMSRLSLHTVHARRSIWQDVSRLYVANMNRFGKAGGYAAFLSRMDANRTAGPASMEELVTYVGFLAAVPRCFVPTFVTEG